MDLTLRAPQKGLIIYLPVRERIYEICMEDEEANITALNQNDEIYHAALMHKESPLMFKCTKCQKKCISMGLCATCASAQELIVLTPEKCLKRL
jgi:hypothetical protein